MLDFIVNADWSILRWIQSLFGCGFMDFLMPKITLLGDSGAIWVLTAIVMLCTKKYRKNGILLLTGLAAGLLIGNIALKNLVARPRPCWLDTDFVLLLTSPTDYSFPSGHTLASVISATILTMTNKKFGFAAIPLAALIAFSRLYLFVHYPSDVFAAAILGFVIGIAVYINGGRIYDKLSAKYHEKKKNSNR